MKQTTIDLSDCSRNRIGHITLLLDNHNIAYSTGGGLHEYIVEVNDTTKAIIKQFKLKVVDEPIVDYGYFD